MNVPGRTLHDGQKVEITQIWIGSMDEWMSKLWYIYTMKYYSTIKRMKHWYKLLIQLAWTWKTLCYVNEARHKRSHNVWFQLFEISRIGKSTERERRLVVAKHGKMRGRNGEYGIIKSLYSTLSSIILFEGWFGLSENLKIA